MAGRAMVSRPRWRQRPLLGGRADHQAPGPARAVRAAVPVRDHVEPAVPAYARRRRHIDHLPHSALGFVPDEIRQNLGNGWHALHARIQRVAEQK